MPHGEGLSCCSWSQSDVLPLAAVNACKDGGPNAQDMNRLPACCRGLHAEPYSVQMVFTCMTAGLSIFSSQPCQGGGGGGANGLAFCSAALIHQCGATRDDGRCGVAGGEVTRALSKIRFQSRGTLQKMVGRSAAMSSRRRVTSPEKKPIAAPTCVHVMVLMRS